MRSRVWIRRFASACLILGGAAGLAANSSCVLLDGPADLQLPATRRPTILRSQVIPSASLPLGDLPAGDIFTVPLEIPDPSQSVTWIAYLDLNGVQSISEQQSAQLVSPQTIVGSSNAPDINTTPAFSVQPSRVQGNACHTIHFIVALTSAFNNSDPDPNLSDTIDWFIAPGGNYGGCTTFDGGGVYSIIPDAAASDASDDGAD